MSPDSSFCICRHLEPGDVYVHADVGGARPCIVKARPGIAQIPPATLEQAGTWCLCRSDAWTSRAVTSAWWVPEAQVQRAPPPGARLAPGVFLVPGTRRFLPPSPLLMGFSVLFKLPPERVAAHLHERRVKPGAAEAGDVAEDEAGEQAAVEAEGEEEGEEEGELASDDDDDGPRRTFGAGGELQVSRGKRAAAAAVAEAVSEGGQGLQAAEKEAAAAQVSAHTLQAAGSGRSGPGGPGGRGGPGGGARPAKPTGAKAPAGASESVRGKKGKLKKMKAKYADQDEEDKELFMSVLGSAGQSKQQLAADKARAAREAKAAAQREAEARHEERQRRAAEAAQAKRQAQADEKARREAARQVDADDADDAEDAEDGDAEAGALESELAALLEETSIATLSADERVQIGLQDLLTASPADGEKLLFALPMCAPYSSLAGCKYKVKLTPGSQKKGKAARQAVSVCCNSAPSRERELMLAVADDELCRTMIGNVKVVATGQQIAQATRSLKAEKKAVATARAKGKGNDE